VVKQVIYHMNNKTCKVTQYCLRNEFNGLYSLNFKGYLIGSDNRPSELFDAKIIKNDPKDFNNYINTPNKEDRVLLSAEGYWWQVHIELNNINNSCLLNQNIDALQGYEFTQNEINGMNDEDDEFDSIQKLEFTSFNNKNHYDFGIPMLVWSIMIGMITT
jgi:hypothetical protein